MAHIAVSSTLVLLFAILVPRYMQAILDVDPDNAVVVFAPVAIGALFGLRGVPLIVSWLGKIRTVALGLALVGVFLMGFGLVETIAAGLERTDQFNPFGPDATDRIFGLSILVALTMLFAGPMGFGYALLNTPAQTIVHERTPVDMRGRVVAAQMVLANGVALLPLVVVGGIADLYGVSQVILALAVLLVLGAGLSVYLEYQWLRSEGGQPPPSGGEKGPPDRPSGAVSDSIDSTRDVG